MQTIAGALFRPEPAVPVRTERLELPDGDFLDIDWLEGPEEAPLVVILHGLGSSSRVSYVLTLLQEIQKRGWRAVAVNARGTTGPNRLLETSHGGRTGDVDWVIRTIRERNPSQTLYLAGYSIGGNQALKWLGEQGAQAPVAKAVAVSVPYRLAVSVKHLDQGFNQKVYTSRVLKILKERAFEKEKLFPGSIDVEKVKRADTYRVYDREVTAKLNGFRNEEDYWEQSSCAGYLDQIRRPTLLIHAANDPLFLEEDMPLETIEASAYLDLKLSGDGGHLGFVAGRIPFQVNRWLEETILDYLASEK